MNLWPLSLEEKWRFFKRLDPEWPERDGADPYRWLYVTQKENEFFYRAKHPEKYVFYSCRFCRIEGWWSSDVAFEHHIRNCDPAQRVLEKWDMIRAIGERIRLGLSATARHYLRLTDDTIFHRGEIMEFSGGPESSEGEIIHNLIESWEYEPCGPISFAVATSSGSRRNTKV